MRDYELAGYIISSSYRLRTVMVLSEMGYATPTQIATQSNILKNHISKVLKELKERDVVECINENARKGRVYTLTDNGKKVLPTVRELESNAK